MAYSRTELENGRLVNTTIGTEWVGGSGRMTSIASLLRCVEVVAKTREHILSTQHCTQHVHSHTLLAAAAITSNELHHYWNANPTYMPPSPPTQTARQDRHTDSRAIHAQAYPMFSAMRVMVAVMCAGKAKSSSLTTLNCSTIAAFCSRLSLLSTYGRRGKTRWEELARYGGQTQGFTVTLTTSMAPTKLQSECSNNA
jgi:hypothetical protein